MEFRWVDFFLTIHLFTLRNTEVLLVIEKITPQADSTLITVRFIMTHLLVFINIPIEILASTLPLALPQLPLADTVLGAQLFLGLFTGPLGWFYLHKLRKNLYQMKTSRSMYDNVEKKII